MTPEGGQNLRKIERDRHAQGAARNHTCRVSRNRTAVFKDNEVQRLFPYVCFLALKCPFGCEPYYFVSKAALQRHRVRLHKSRRTPNDLPVEHFKYVALLDDIQKIIRRADSDSKEFNLSSKLHGTLSSGDHFPCNWNMN